MTNPQEAAQWPGFVENLGSRAADAIRNAQIRNLDTPELGRLAEQIFALVKAETAAAAAAGYSRGLAAAAERVRPVEMRHIELRGCDCDKFSAHQKCPSLMPYAVERHDSRLGDTRGCWRCRLEQIAAALAASARGGNDDAAADSGGA